MEVFGIAVVAAALMGAWHVTKYAVPRTMRAVGGRRRSSIDGWKAAHPGAPGMVRWAAGLAGTVAAVRWGPRHLLDETRKAWQEGFEKGREKYGAQPQPDPTDPNDTKNCPVCHGEVVVDGDICPRCLARQEERNTEWDITNPQPSPRPGDWKPSPRPLLVSVPTGTDPKPDPKENEVSIETATGGEITNAEQFHAEAKSVVKEAAADMEDAAADNARAQEDLGRIEQMVASLSKQQAVASDIAAVAALQDPATARAAAAKDRAAAAEQRLAGAKVVEQIAAKHVQLIGTATGPFYNA